MMKALRYIFEAIGVFLLYGVFKILPLDTASALGGILGRFIGMRMATTRKAKRRLQEAIPNLSEAEYTQILAGMWENLGRVVAEYPHLKQIGAERTVIQGQAILEDSVLAGKPAIIFGVHAANWEICAPTLLAQTGVDLHITYRAPNNPWVDKLLMRARTLRGRITAYPKSRESGRLIMGALKNNTPIGILIDQKYNEGVAVPFMGKVAMTNPAFVQLAQRFKCPIIPARNVRLPGKAVRFALTFYAPLGQEDEDAQPLPLENVVESAHLMIEEWIKDDPSCWLWLHDRWGSEQVKDNKENE